MKIITHTFKVPTLEIKDGELVVGEEKEVRCSFTLLLKGMGIYEEITGKPLMSDIMKVASSGNNDEEAAMALMSGRVLRNLACASYVKIDGQKFHNNRATAEEFRKSEVYSLIDKDFDFVMKLYTMALECIDSEAESKSKTKSEVIRRKK